MSTNINYEKKMDYLRCQIDYLKKEKLEATNLLYQNLNVYLNTDRIDHIKNMVEEYLTENISEKCILNVADCKTFLKVLRDMFAEDESQNTTRNNLWKKLDKYSVKSLRNSVNKSSKTPRSLLTLTKSLSTKKKLEKQLSFSTPPDPLKSSSVQSLLVEKRSSKSTFVHESSPSISSEDDSQSVVIINRNKRPSKRRMAKFGKIHSVSGQSVGSYRSVLSDSFTGRKSTPPLVFCPEGIAGKKKIWEEYRSDPAYTSLYHEFTANEVSLKETYENYLAQMEILLQLRDTVEEKRNDISEVKLFKHFNMLCTTDKIDKAVLVEKEALYEEAFEKELEKVRKQTVAVLNIQSQLRRFSETSREIKTQLNNDFANFSMRINEKS